MIKNTVLGVALSGFAAVGLATSAMAGEAKLPKSMIWSAYDLGSSGYAEASGMANALQKKYPTRIRIVPAGTSIGRLLPMTTGKVRYGFLANEVYFATEGTYDFATEAWGPQDLRILMGRPASVGLGCAGDVGITDIASLKGKRIGYVKGNPSVNVKTDGAIAFGNLTRKDVQAVIFGSYRALKDAILANQLDCMMSVTTSANMRQIEASSRKLYWPEYPISNKKGWAGITKIMSFAAPQKTTIGAAISKDKPRILIGYRYPMMTTYASTPVDEVYNVVKALDEAFGLYNSTTGSSKNWAIARSMRPPADAPWHDGAIKYAKEKGIWTKEDQAWHDKRLARLKLVQATWDKAVEDFHAMRVAKKSKGEKVSAKKAWPTWWQSYRDKHLN